MTRRFASVVLGVLVCLLSIASVLAVWARGELLDTDRYVADVGPLATNAAIEQEVANQVTDAILTQFPTRIRDDVRPGIQAQADLFVKSPAFPVVWLKVNRTAHAGLVALLRDQRSSAVVVRDGRLFLDLSPVVVAVEAQVAKVSPDLVAALPPITLRVDVADAHRIEQARPVVRWLDRWAYWLPVLTIVLFLVTVLTAHRRLRSAGVALLGIAMSLAVLRLLVRAGAELAVHRVPNRTVDPDAIRAVYGRLTLLLATSATWVAVGAAVLGLVAYLLGPRSARP